MPSLSVTKYVEAPPPRVFEVFADLAHASERIESIERIEVLTEGPVGAGTRFRETRIMFGRSNTQEMEFVAFEPPRSYTVRCDAHGTRYLSRYDFHAEGKGTRVEMRFDVTPVSLFARLLSPLGKLMMGSLKKTLAAELDSLGAVAEQGGESASEREG